MPVSKYVKKHKNGTPYPGSGGINYEFAPEMGEIHLTRSVYLPALREHRHSFVELVCITEGCGVHIIDGQPNRTRRGDIYLIDYGMSHNFRSLSDDFEWINCIFRPEYLCDAFDLQENAVSLLYYIFYNNVSTDKNAVALNMNLRNFNEDLTGFFENMLWEYDRKLHGYEEILRNYLNILLMKIARRIFAKTHDGGILERGAAVIEDVIRELNSKAPGSISAKQLANSYFMSQSTFSENFKKYIGCSFVEYVTELRIRYTCELLLTSDMPIYDIQSCVGYRDTKSFYRAFHRCTGMTPTDYRLKHKAEKNNIKNTLQLQNTENL